MSPHSAELEAAERTIKEGGSVANQDLLKELVKLDRVGLKALSVIEDQAFLEMVALNSGNDGTGLNRGRGKFDRILGFEALKRVSSQDALNRISEQAIDPRIRVKAVTQITDENLLILIVSRSSSYWKERLAATRGIREQNTLRKVAEVDGSWEVRMAAAEHLEDKACLRRIIENDLDGSVAEVAAKRLSSLGVLELPPFRCPKSGIERELLHLPVVEPTPGSKRLTFDEAAKFCLGMTPDIFNLRSTTSCGKDMGIETRVGRVGREEFQVTERALFSSF